MVASGKPGKKRSGEVSRAVWFQRRSGFSGEGVAIKNGHGPGGGGEATFGLPHGIAAAEALFDFGRFRRNPAGEQR